jgi:hypothetical protein
MIDRITIYVLGMLVVAFCLSVGQVRADTATYPTQFEAFVACNAPPLAPPAGRYSIKTEIIENLGAKQYSCDHHVGYDGNPPTAYQIWPCQSWPVNSGAPDICVWTQDHQCTVGESYEVVANTPEPANWCDGGCIFEATTGSYDEASGLGIFVAENTGTVCPFEDPGLDEPDLPVNCVRNESTGAISCDCSVNPNAAYCQVPPDNPDAPVPPNCVRNETTGVVSCAPPNDPFPNDPSGPDDPNPPPPFPDPGDDQGDNEGDGDGDPNTPGDGDGGDPDDSEGTGDGDTNDDGERDVDCNPLSNPDCPFRGSGSSSDSCDTAPTCTGDPVQCTIVKQIWQSNCLMLQPGEIPSELTNELTEVKDGQFLEGRNDETNFADGIQFDDSGYLGSGSCPATESVNLGFLGNFVVDYVPFCYAAETIGYLIMIMASFVSVRIFLRGIG